MSGAFLPGLLTLVGIGALASCSDEQRNAPTAPTSNITPRSATSASLRPGLAPLLVDGAAFPCVGGETVLLIQDVTPWFSPPNQDPAGADVTELKAQGKQFCMINSDQIGTTDLTVFPEILIAAAQLPTFYDNLFPNGTVRQSISDYVNQGGILSANLTDFFPVGGWQGDVFVGGLQHTSYGSEENLIAAQSHPIIVDELPCGPTGHCGPIVDAGIRDDLDGWDFSSHGYFTNLPDGTQLILVDELNRPVMIEYAFGAGDVIATLTTTEWRYAQDAGIDPQFRKLLANEIAYQDFRAAGCVGASLVSSASPSRLAAARPAGAARGGALRAGQPRPQWGGC